MPLPLTKQQAGMYVTLWEASRFCHLSPALLRRACHAGKLLHKRTGTAHSCPYLIRIRDAMDYVNSLPTGATKRKAKT